MASPLADTHVRNLAATVTNISTGCVTISKIIVVNTSGAVAFLQVFPMIASLVTLATTVPCFSLPVAASSGVLDMDFAGDHAVFPNGLSMASTTTVEGSTGSASGVFLQVFFN